MAVIALPQSRLLASRSVQRGAPKRVPCKESRGLGVGEYVGSADASRRCAAGSRHGGGLVAKSRLPGSIALVGSTEHGFTLRAIPHQSALDDVELERNNNVEMGTKTRHILGGNFPVRDEGPFEKQPYRHLALAAKGGSAPAPPLLL